MKPFIDPVLNCEITTVETIDVNGARLFFEYSSDHRTSDEIYDSAVEFFGALYLESIDYKHKYRQKRSSILSYMSLEEAADMAERHQRMFERVLDARRFLDEHAEVLVQLWLQSDGHLQQSYTNVLADIVCSSPVFIEKYYISAEAEAYQQDCFNAVQWLGMWLRSEAVDEQG